MPPASNSLVVASQSAKIAPCSASSASRSSGRKPSNTFTENVPGAEPIRPVQQDLLRGGSA
eukprot:6714970-Alexandrium_andersonii.AAC.1